MDKPLDLTLGKRLNEAFDKIAEKDISLYRGLVEVLERFLESHRPGDFRGITPIQDAFSNPAIYRAAKSKIKLPQAISTLLEQRRKVIQFVELRCELKEMGFDIEPTMMSSRVNQAIQSNKNIVKLKCADVNDPKRSLFVGLTDWIDGSGLVRSEFTADCREIRRCETKTDTQENYQLQNESPLEIECSDTYEDERPYHDSAVIRIDSGKTNRMLGNMEATGIH